MPFKTQEQKDMKKQKRQKKIRMKIKQELGKIGQNRKNTVSAIHLSELSLEIMKVRINTTENRIKDLEKTLENLQECS